MPDRDALADRLELERTVWSLGRCLDERDFDGLGRLFTADATVTTAATARGRDAVIEQARAAPFAARRYPAPHHQPDH